MRMRAFAGVLAIVALTLLARPLPASAHASLVSSDPADGSTLESFPEQVTLTFDESVDEPAFVTVTAPDGATVTSGDPAVSDATVTQRLDPGSTDGTYTLAFRVMSFDGHPVTGTVLFNLGHPSQPVQAVTEPGAGTTGGDSFISEHVASLTIAMGAITLAICLAILKAGRNRQQQGDA